MRIRGLQFIKISCEGDQPTIPRRPRIGHGPDQTDRSLAIDQTKQTDYCEWARANRPATGYGPDETDRRLDMGQSEQTRDWVLTRRNRPVFGYWPDRTDRKLRIDQTKQTDVWVLARQNRPIFGIGQTERRDRKFVQSMSLVAPDPPVRNPGPSDPGPSAYTCLGSRTSSWGVLVKCR